MRFYDSHEAGVESLKRLMALRPDPGRTECVRVRCHMQLRQRSRRGARIAVITGFTSRVLAPVLVGGFCLFYVAALVATTLRLKGVFQ